MEPPRAGGPSRQLCAKAGFTFKSGFSYVLDACTALRFPHVCVVYCECTRTSSVFQNEGQSSRVTRHRARWAGAGSGREQCSQRRAGRCGCRPGGRGEPVPLLSLGGRHPRTCPTPSGSVTIHSRASSWQVQPLPPRRAAFACGRWRPLSAVKVASVPRPDSACISQPRGITSGHNANGELWEESA